MEDQRTARAVAQRREQGAEAGRAAPRVVPIVVSEELHHQKRCGAAVGHGVADLFADTGLDMGADYAAIETVEQMRRFRRLVDAAKIDDRSDSEATERGAVLVGQSTEMGRAENGAAPHGAAVSRAMAAQVTEIGTALQRHDIGKIG